MTRQDVVPAAAMIRRGDWGDREAFLAWAIDQPACRPFVAEERGAVVGTGVATANGRVGWVGTIFVEPDRRGAGLGRALTGTVVDDLEARGCRTLVLIATAAGRPIYERLGFEVLEEQVHFAIGGLPQGADPAEVVAYEPRHHDAILALDAAATGEDRSAVLNDVLGPETTRIVSGPDARPAGFVVRATWGGAALVARQPEAAVRLLDWRRRRAGPDGRVGIGLMAGNEGGRRLLLAAGWTQHGGATRMIRGEPLRWRPQWLWGQFNGAIG